MADLIHIARPYAKAAFEYAKAQDNVEKWSEMLVVLGEILKIDTVKKLLSDPTISQYQAAEVLIDLLDGKCDEFMGNFIKVLGKQRRLTSVVDIITLFHQFRSTSEKVVEAHMQTAYQVDDAYVKNIAKKLEKRLGSSVSLQAEVNPDILGGAVITAGDLVIDGSLKTKLKRMAAEISA